MLRILCILLFLVPALMIQSCTTFQRTVQRDDPLIHSIIDVSRRTAVDFDTLMAAVQDADVIYLSEKHDNHDQHQAQKAIIRWLIDSPHPPAIGFEFFAMNDTPDLLNFIDSGTVDHPADALADIETHLRNTLGWDTQSDVMWSYYFDLLSLARDHHLSVAGLDLSSTLKRRITRKGMAGISAIEKDQIFSTGLDNDAYQNHMYAIFKAVHCGMGNEAMQSRLYDTWVARNDTMAQSITQLAAHTPGPVVVIVGGGHTEYGLGVMDRVSAINPDIRQVNVALQEISITPQPLEGYLEPLDLEGFEPRLPADYIWFFQRQSYADPCEKFKAALKRMPH